MELDFLDCGDGALRTGEAEEDALIEPPARLAPRPGAGADARATATRTTAAPTSWSKRPASTPACATDAGPASRYRPAAVFSYMQHDPFAPSFIVDVTAVWEAKIESLRAYRSQLYQTAAKAEETGAADQGGFAASSGWRSRGGRATSG